MAQPLQEHARRSELLAEESHEQQQAELLQAAGMQQLEGEVCQQQALRSELRAAQIEAQEAAESKEAELRLQQESEQVASTAALVAELQAAEKKSR